MFGLDMVLVLGLGLIFVGEFGFPNLVDPYVCGATTGAPYVIFLPLKDVFWELEFLWC